MKVKNKGLLFQRHGQPGAIWSLLFAVVPVVFRFISRFATNRITGVSRVFRRLSATWSGCAFSGVIRSSGGSMLMEYLLVQVLVACFLMLAMNALFYNWSSGSLVKLGLEVKYFFQRLLGGLSLPVP